LLGNHQKTKQNKTKNPKQDCGANAFVNDGKGMAQRIAGPSLPFKAGTE
jgi:hypothetical protein